MTIANNYVLTKQATNGSTKVFSFNFYALNADYIKVIKETDGVQTVINPSDYTVDFDENDGTVTFATAPASGSYIIIYRDTPKEQETPFATSSGFPAKTMENRLDKLTAMVQEDSESLDRSVKFPKGNTTSVEMPLPDPGKSIVWNEDGDALKNSTYKTDEIAATAQQAASDASDYATAASGSATAASGSASAASTSATKAQTWAEGNDTDVAALGGTHSSLVSAGLSYSYANAGFGEDVEEFAANHDIIVQGEKGGKGDKGDPGDITLDSKIIANGTTTGRTLGERFGDIVNVKDFGAKGDGITDDTSAFEAALAKNKTIFVPSGSYNISKRLYGKFITDNNLTFTNKKVYVENINYIGNDLRKDIFAVFDYEFPGYSDCVTVFGVDIASVACCFVVNEETNEKLVFVGYKPKTGTGTVISCYNLTTDSFVGYNYSTSIQISEGLVVKYNSGFDIYINPMSDQKIYKAKFIGDGSAITFAQYSSFENENKMAYRNGTWLLRTLSKNNSDRKFNMVLTDESFNVVSQITLPIFEYDILSDYTSSDMIQHKIPHKQGIGLLDNSWCFFAGGSSSGQYNNGEENNGAIEYSFEGNFIRSSICNTDQYMTLLSSVSGTEITWMENEGGFVDDSNKVFSMNTVKFSNNVKKLYFIEEFSKSATSFDCSGIFNFAHYGNVLNKLSSVSFPYFYGNKLKNPLTNEDFNTIDDVAQFMRKANISYLKITDALTYGLYSACGTNIIDPSSTSKFYTIELTNKDGSSCIVDITTANQNHTQDKEIAKRSYVIYNLGSTPTFNLNSQMVNTLYVMGSSTRESSASLNEKPIIQFNGGGEADILWETYRDITSKYALMRFIDNGSACYWDIGYSASYKSPQQVRIGVHSTYGSKNKDAGLVIKSDTAYPAANSTMSLGQSSMKWTEVFADTATINTSDERQKQEIEDVDEKVLRAWGKVNFKQFLFNESVKKKGKENARIHIGLIAQQVKNAFESEGLDGFKYGLLCYDSWDDEIYEETVVDEEAVFDEDGNIVTPAKTHVERRVDIKAGDSYGIRYEEALALECAYQRWITNKLEERLEKLEK